MFNFSLRSKSKLDDDSSPSQKAKQTKQQSSRWGFSNKQNENVAEEEEDDEDDDIRQYRRRPNNLPYNNGVFDDYNYYEEISSADILPTDKEKTGILQLFTEMRRESAFCDIAFTCQGTIFRAHKVIVSAWSRWLRSLLLEGSDDEVLSLDIFDPQALSSVLDYMYGVPLHIDVEVADNILKVVRRLELQDLEQQCWRFLISVMNEDNCNDLHDIADRYDCPPLKLAAFRMLQDIDPAYSFVPITWNVDKLKENFTEGVRIRSGLTGPGEKNFYVMSGGYEDYEEEDDRKNLSVLDFARKRGEGETDSDGNDINDDEDQQRLKITDTVFPDKLPPNATATEVVRAWGARLQYIYEQCLPPTDDDEEQFDDEDNEDYEEEDQGEQQNIKQGERVGQGKNLPPPTPSTIRFNYTKAPSRRFPQRVVQESKQKGFAGLDWSKELKRFYLAIKRPEKLAKIDDILKTWEGREDQMLSELIIKYKKKIPRTLLDYFDRLQSALETQTESSFVHNAAAANFNSKEKSKRGPKTSAV